ncbi:MAG: hypothetical protein QT10_C0001G0015 [archaeon GW2011_AR19]|nr:MAG: hypothetical protein QT10_C0001G0015 [archaeon GW2011_AR19]
MTKAIINPINPRIKIPIAETFATFSNSSFVGFFKVCQTRTHLLKKDFIDSMIKLERQGF